MQKIGNMAGQQHFIQEILFLVAVFLYQSDHVSCDSAADFRLSLEDDIIQTYGITVNKANHMEFDQFVPRNILYSNWFSLQTTDGNVTHMIVGSLTEQGYREGNGTAARFRALRGFIQLNETAVIVADDWNHCLRLVDRLTNQTSVYAGVCTQGSRRDGPALNALFSKPQQIILDKLDPNLLFITGNQLIRKITIKSYRVWTLTKESPGILRGIVQVPVTGNFYVSAFGKVVRVFRSNGKFETVAGYKTEGTYPQGWSDGPLSRTLFHELREIILVSNGTMLLVADPFNQRIRVLDLITNTSSSIGSARYPAHDDGLLSNCTLFQPVSLMVTNDAIYVGEQRQIRVIRNQQPVTTTMTPPFRCPAVDKILISSGVSVVTVSIVIVIGVLYYKLNTRGARSGISSTTMSWNGSNDEASDVPNTPTQGQINVTGYENVAHTAVSSS